MNYSMIRRASVHTRKCFTAPHTFLALPLTFVLPSERASVAVPSGAPGHAHPGEGDQQSNHRAGSGNLSGAELLLPLPLLEGVEPARKESRGHAGERGEA